MNQTTSKQSKKCQNIFLEDDGYCTACGRNHFVEAFGKTYFYQPDAVNKEEASSYSDMESGVDADANQAEYDEKGHRKYTVIVTKTADSVDVEVH